MVWASDTDMVNAALVHINAMQIENIDDGSPTAYQAKPLLPLIKHETIGCHPWRFCRRRALLERLEDSGEAPLYLKKYRFKIPSWLIGTTFSVIELGHEHCVPDWTQAGEYIYSNTENLVIEGNEDVPVSQYPAYFCNFISRVIAAQLAAIILQDTGLSQAQYVMAYGSQDQRGDNGLLRIARELDGFGEPAKTLKFALPMVDNRKAGW